MSSRLWACIIASSVCLTLSTVSPARADDAGTVILIKDGKFVPADVSVPANTKVKLIVRNQDSSMSEFESVELHREKTVAPGREITVFVGPLDAGSYEFFDDFHPQNRGHLVAK
jgi:heme/copper-type cytochrome/quinol oxidase subunit 2